MAIGVFWVMALFLPVMVEAQGGPPAEAGGLNAKIDEILTNQDGLDAKLDELLENQADILDGLQALRVQANTHSFVSHDGVCGTGDDRFVDLGLTIYDCQENLEWEKKTEDNVDDTFTWSTCTTNPPAPVFGACGPDGTAFDYIAQLNTPPCFAGHCDWRLPEMGPPFDFLGGVKLNGDPADTEELRTIQDCSFGSCVDPIFGPTLLSGPTPEDTNYWTSVTIAGFPSSAWSANFYASIGGTGATGKSLSISVRAVRNGP